LRRARRSMQKEPPLIGLTWMLSDVRIAVVHTVWA
jgi:hypothetical protein